ncbi:MAG: hypothetical protein H6621_02085 [Halobacteriovoraceae bacterium]|nr:hypothetical protein [Halobacteriovoraceae bacterium]MCB9093832.1 hypothetical protein [Halobacteriovoraceae bacterium]
MNRVLALGLFAILFSSVGYSTENDYELELTCGTLKSFKVKKNKHSGYLFHIKVNEITEVVRDIQFDGYLRQLDLEGKAITIWRNSKEIGYLKRQLDDLVSLELDSFVCVSNLIIGHIEREAIATSTDSIEDAASKLIENLKVLKINDEN